MPQRKPARDYRYFSDINGVTVELTAVTCMNNPTFTARWPGIAGIRYGGGMMWVGKAKEGREQGLFPVTRIIAYKAFAPSLHECSAKCMNGNPRGACECQCGGANHGIS